jgi:hypothetical protein
MVDAVGEAEQSGADDQCRVAEMQAQRNQRAAAQSHAEDQNFSRADAIDDITDRRLSQAGHDGEHGERQAQVDIGDAKPVFQEREQHRQHEDVEVADPVRHRDRAERPPGGIDPHLL